MKNLTPRQQEILNVALELFYKRAFADTSMRDIAEVLNVKAASLYAHIKSKEEIMEWISDDVSNRFMKRYNDLKNPNLSPLEKVKILVEKLGETKAKLRELENSYPDLSSLSDIQLQEYSINLAYF